MTFPPLRNQAEIQHAHDVIIGLLLVPDLVKHILPEERMQNDALAYAAALCWCLNHNHNQTFAKNLTAIEAALRAEGIALFDPSEGLKNGNREN